ncbi:GNAT family N-acetyltransferase [Methylobacterium sp. J-072]|uniref:GNAT family N-acetyltransferase n=1 Tax=Methylobacterium sp. J-072 TaxID=2836651 RepID=UPI001FBA3973|nr:GNAT family N-acetyltransferase [Methylobacterium sp. J-072]MCJ2092780.1 GNAT family N-acetyltransferase [Methylobacterium sp. J-072]
MLPFPRPSEMRTERLVLRPLRHADAAPLFATYTGDLEVTRYLPWRRHRSRNQTEAMIRVGEDLAESRTAYLMAITLHDDTSSPIGLLNIGDSEHGISVGFGLAQNRWGGGYGSEIIAHVCKWLLDRPTVWRVWGYCDAENAASARVMVKAGMQFEGTLGRFAVHPNLAFEPRDCQLFAAIRG